MYIKSTYRAIEMAWWTRFETFLFLLIGIAWVSAYHFLDMSWLKIPWTPLALIGTAVAFVIGFQNNAAYGRIWEARKIWGGITNASRTFGFLIQDMVSNEHAITKRSQDDLQAEIKTLTYRHIGWVTALRHSMRVLKPWETTALHRTNTEWGIKPPERDAKVEEELESYLSESDLNYALTKDNRQTAILYLQSHHIRKMKDEGVIWEFSFLELESMLKEMMTLQGKSERIKNFPYPRQFATLNHFFMWIFVLLLPLALVPQFSDIGNEIISNYPVIGKFFIWLCVPFYAAVAWVFHTMERIGRTGENPFEGTSNDVPISTMARGIEIDLRQNLGEPKDEIPEQYPTPNNVQF